jgi:hypothetical protein
MYRCKRKGWCPPTHYPQLTWKATSSGVFFVEVRDYASTEQSPQYPLPYTLVSGTVRGDAAADVADAAPLAVGTSSHEMEGEGRTHTFRLEAVGGSQYSLTAAFAGGRGGLVRVFASDGVSEVATGLRSFGYTANRDASEVSWVSPATGTYYVTVGGFAAAAYDLSLGQILDDQEGEARRVSNPGRSGGSIDFPYDEDTFLIEAEAGKVYAIRSDDDALAHIAVRRVGGTELVSELYDAWGPSVTFAAAETGTYEVRLGGIVARTRSPSTRRPTTRPGPCG